MLSGLDFFFIVDWGKHKELENSAILFNGLLFISIFWLCFASICPLRNAIHVSGFILQDENPWWDVKFDILALLNHCRSLSLLIGMESTFGTF